MMAEHFLQLTHVNIEKEVFMKEVIARLKEHQSATPSKWRERAEWRHIIGSQSDYSHNLPAESNQFPGFFYTLHQPGAVVGTLLLTHIFHSLSSLHETLSIFTREYRCFFYGSCHCCNL